MQTSEEDCSWEEVYRANGVRCDIEESSLHEGGVCPTPLVNPFPFYQNPVEKWASKNHVSLDTFA